MIHIDLKIPDQNSSWKAKWDAWRNKCDQEQKLLNESYEKGQKIAVKKSVYDGMKDFYFALDGPFFGKCAYCESLIDENQPGDLDHFRPKGAVKDKGQVVRIQDGSGNTIDHPGYYWLAYDYLNLLPSCELCNRPNKRKTPDLIGKWEEFPVKGFRAKRPGEETSEDPEFINPVAASDEEISKHFEVAENGVVVCKTPKAEAHKRIFGLNDRQSLISSRQKALMDGRNTLFLCLTAINSENRFDFEFHRKEIESIDSGNCRFAAAARKGLSIARKRYAPYSGELFGYQINEPED